MLFRLVVTLPTILCVSATVGGQESTKLPIPAKADQGKALAVVKEVIDYFDPADAGERQKALQRFEAEARTLGDLKHRPQSLDQIDAGHRGRHAAFGQISRGPTIWRPPMDPLDEAGGGGAPGERGAWLGEAEAWGGPWTDPTSDPLRRCRSPAEQLPREPSNPYASKPLLPSPVPEVPFRERRLGLDD